MHARLHGTNGGLPQLPSSQICLIWAFRECNFPLGGFHCSPRAAEGLWKGLLVQAGLSGGGAARGVWEEHHRAGISAACFSSNPTYVVLATGCLMGTHVILSSRFFLLFTGREDAHVSNWHFYFSAFKHPPTHSPPARGCTETLFLASHLALLLSHPKSAC